MSYNDSAESLSAVNRKDHEMRFEYFMPYYNTMDIQRYKQ